MEFLSSVGDLCGVWVLAWDEAAIIRFEVFDGCLVSCCAQRAWESTKVRRYGMLDYCNLRQKRKQSLRKVLDDLLLGANLYYKEVNGNILINKRALSDRKLRGRIVESDKKSPLPFQKQNCRLMDYISPF